MFPRQVSLRFLLGLVLGLSVSLVLRSYEELVRPRTDHARNVRLRMDSFHDLPENDKNLSGPTDVRELSLDDASHHGKP